MTDQTIRITHDVGLVKKNAVDALFVSVVVRNEIPFLDIRTGRRDAGALMARSNPGISIRLDRAKELIRTIEDAEDLACRIGIRVNDWPRVGEAW